MAATITSMAMLSVKCTTNSHKNHNTQKQIPKPISILSLQNLPKGLISSKAEENPKLSTLFSSTTIAGVVFSTLSSSDAAFAAQQIAEIAEGDNRGLALLLPIIPAIAWVLFNILQPALNQLNKMRSDKGVIIGMGLGGLSAAGFMYAPDASANEIAAIADASSSSDARGQLLLFVIAPAILWVLYNILQPALNQLNKMRSG